MSTLRRIVRLVLEVSEPGRRPETEDRSQRPARGAGSAADRSLEPYEEIDLILLDDGAMRELNRAFRGLDRTTDVLSFDLRPASLPGEPLTGEVAVSTDRVMVQARRYRTSPGRELARLTVHGLLHLQGHDHRYASERRRMRSMERLMMARIAAEPDHLVSAGASKSR